MNISVQVEGKDLTDWLVPAIRSAVKEAVREQAELHKAKLDVEKKGASGVEEVTTEETKESVYTVETMIAKLKEQAELHRVKLDVAKKGASGVEEVTTEETAKAPAKKKTRKKAKKVEKVAEEVEESLNADFEEETKESVYTFETMLARLKELAAEHPEGIETGKALIRTILTNKEYKVASFRELKEEDYDGVVALAETMIADVAGDEADEDL